MTRSPCPLWQYDARVAVTDWAEMPDDMFHADLHVHSKLSRACSKDCDIEHLSWWALRKGLTVLGTGDFTHPAWAAELRETLVPAEPGLFRIRPELESRLLRDTPTACAGTVRFLLSVEISTIYRRDERTRKVHHLLYAPGFDEADRITAALAKIGNLASDGRPILGLDSRDLLDIDHMLPILDTLLARRTRDEVVNLASGRDEDIEDIVGGLEDRLGVRADRKLIEMPARSGRINVDKLRKLIPALDEFGFGPGYLDGLLDRHIDELAGNARAQLAAENAEAAVNV